MPDHLVPYCGATAIKPTAVIAWTLSVGTSLRKSQAKTLADLVAAAMQVSRLRLAGLKRRLAGTALCKHPIKRLWRFCANPRIPLADGMRGVIEQLYRRAAINWG